jgi:hypothetical protein
MAKEVRFGIEGARKAAARGRQPTGSNCRSTELLQTQAGASLGVIVFMSHKTTGTVFVERIDHAPNIVVQHEGDLRFGRWQRPTSEHCLEQDSRRCSSVYDTKSLSVNPSWAVMPMACVSVG